MESLKIPRYEKLHIQFGPHSIDEIPNLDMLKQEIIHKLEINKTLNVAVLLEEANNSSKNTDLFKKNIANGIGIKNSYIEAMRLNILPEKEWGDFPSYQVARCKILDEIIKSNPTARKRIIIELEDSSDQEVKKDTQDYETMSEMMEEVSFLFKKGNLQESLQKFIIFIQILADYQLRRDTRIGQKVMKLIQNKSIGSTILCIGSGHDYLIDFFERNNIAMTYDYHDRKGDLPPNYLLWHNIYNDIESGIPVNTKDIKWYQALIGHEIYTYCNNNPQIFRKEYSYSELFTLMTKTEEKFKTIKDITGFQSMIRRFGIENAIQLIM